MFHRHAKGLAYTADSTCQQELDAFGVDGHELSTFLPGTSVNGNAVLKLTMKDAPAPTTEAPTTEAPSAGGAGTTAATPVVATPSYTG